VKALIILKKRGGAKCDGQLGTTVHDKKLGARSKAGENNRKFSCVREKRKVLTMDRSESQENKKGRFTAHRTKAPRKLKLEIALCLGYWEKKEKEKV